MKTLDINFKEWFDKVNGNSYCAGEVVIDYGMDSEKTFNCPFEYGYGNYYEQRAEQCLRENGILKQDIGGLHLNYYCRDHGIIVRSNIQRGCLKRELKQYDVVNN